MKRMVDGSWYYRGYIAWWGRLESGMREEREETRREGLKSKKEFLSYDQFSYANLNWFRRVIPLESMCSQFWNGTKVVVVVLDWIARVGGCISRS